MTRTLALVATLAASVALTACSPAPAAPVRDDPADITAVNGVRDGFMAAYNAGDADAVSALYTEDAVSEPNNQPTLEGRDAIIESLRSMFGQVSLNLQLTPDETTTLGNVGLDRGTYSVEVTPMEGPTTTVEGRYLVLLVKGEDGTWRVMRDFDNAAQPADMAMAAADPGAEAVGEVSQ